MKLRLKTHVSYPIKNWADYEEEQKFKAQWQKLKDDGVSDLPPYEEWIKNELAEYDAWAIQDRQYWIAAGCPTDRAYANHGGRR